MRIGEVQVIGDFGTWGLVDDHPDNIAGAPVAGKGFGTNSTWANEYISGDGVSKTESNRYSVRE